MRAKDCWGREGEIMAKEREERPWKDKSDLRDVMKTKTWGERESVSGKF